MTSPLEVVVDSGADARWAAWQARGVENDCRSGLVMGWAFAMVVVLVLGRLVTQFPGRYSRADGPPHV